MAESILIFGMQKIFRIMKLTIILTVICIVQVFAWEGVSQTRSLTVEIKNASIENVLLNIEEQSRYVFLYNKDVIDVKRKVDVQLKEVNIEDVLKHIFEGSGVEYRILNNQIALSPGYQQQPQERTVKGKVTDASGLPLPGVTVIIKGTSQGVITDTEGNYSLPNVGADAILNFSFVGMKTQEIPVAGQTTINLVMEGDVIGIDEVVAIGYGSMKKGEVTSAVASVEKEKFVKGMIKSPEQLLQGKVAGLQITNFSGDPVLGLQMTIRGVNSLSGNTSPLIVIDGIPGGSLNAISSEDIESVDVLKDGSAAAIYGTRGTNGVVIITTNRAKATAPTAEYNTSVSIESISKHADMLTADDYRQYKDDPAFVGMIDEGSTTDWVDAISRTAISHNHFLSLRGGSNQSSYIASVEYKDREGVINKTDRESLTAKLGINHVMFDNKLRFSANINDSYVTQQRVWYAAYLHALLQNPTNPIYDENGDYTEYRINLKPFNPVSMINEEYDKEGYNQLMMNGKMTFSPISEINLSVMGAFQRFDRMENKSNTFKHMSTVVNNNFGNVWNWADNSYEKTLEVVGDYTKSFQNHNVTAMVGYSFIEDDAKGIYQWAKDFPTDIFGPWNIGSLNEMKDDKADMSSYRNSHRLISFFGRATYNYADKYLFMASVRREGSTRFGANHQWGLFPAVSGGWRISKEAFMQDVRFFDDLKLRVGYGVTGNEVTQNYLSLYLLNYSGFSYLNGRWVQGSAPYQNPNPDLRWETKKELNLGLDFTVLNQRLSGSLDIYRRVTSDLLANYVVPTPPNIISSMTANVGEIENKGVELLLNGNVVKTQNFTFDIAGTLAYNENKIKSLSNEKYQRDYWYEGWTGSPIQTHTHIVKQGEAVGNFHGYQTYGLTDEGLWQILGADGNPKLLSAGSDSDKRVIGNGIPSTYASLTFSLGYKKFDFSLMLRGAFDYQILNTQRMHFETTKRIGEGNLPRSVLDKPFGSSSFVTDSPSMQSYYVEDGDFVKIDNVNLGYSFDFIGQNVIQKMRVYVAGTNLHTFTNYKGLDPEVNVKGLAPGVDGAGTGSTYPTTSLITFGVNLSF